MSYQSLEFLIFSSCALFLYYILGQKRQLHVLALANLTFYAIADIKYIPFFLVVMVTTFFTAKKIGQIYEDADKKLLLCSSPAEKKIVRSEAKDKAKKMLLIGMFVTLLLLVVCKYTGFILENVNKLFSIINIPQITMFKMILPLGISFYSFMALSYVLDVYWKRYKAEDKFLPYAVYLSYFPHVVQGPIDRFNDFKEQLKDGVAFSYKNITFGAQLAMWGFFKKLVIADRLGILVDKVVDSYAEYDGMILMLTFAIYSIQIYADFSGCIDIVSGISEMFGIRMRKNFNHPYFSKTMPEFWRRWHMSLNEWFKDYVYYPVSASKLMKDVKKHLKLNGFTRAMDIFSSCFPILIVWIVTGIWHGAAWKYVIWGMFHATLLISGVVFEPLVKKLTNLFKLNTENFGWQFIQMIRTFVLCCIGRVFFRAGSFSIAVMIFKRIATTCSLGALFAEGLDLGLDSKNLFVAFVSICVLWCVDMMQEKMSIRENLAKQNIVFRWVIFYIAIVGIVVFGIHGPAYNASSFIYEQF